MDSMGNWQVHELPKHLQKLHDRVQQARRDERHNPQVEDEEGRTWGPKSLRRASRRRNQQTGRST